MGCKNCGPAMTPSGRVIREPGWPQGGAVTRPLADRRYEVQAFTGRPVSTVPQGRWNRGFVVRFMTPEVRPAVWPLYMMDPTDPVRFVTVVSDRRKRGLLASRGRR